jgi:hypothetical protein
MRYTLNNEPDRLEIWRDGAPMLEIAAARGVMLPADNGAHVMPDGSRAYRKSGPDALPRAEVEAEAARLLDLLNGAHAEPLESVFAVRFTEGDDLHRADVIDGAETAADASPWPRNTPPTRART